MTGDTKLAAAAHKQEARPKPRFAISLDKIKKAPRAPESVMGGSQLSTKSDPRMLALKMTVSQPKSSRREEHGGIALPSATKEKGPHVVRAPPGVPVRRT